MFDTEQTLASAAHKLAADHLDACADDSVQLDTSTYATQFYAALDFAQADCQVVA